MGRRSAGVGSVRYRLLFTGHTRSLIATARDDHDCRAGHVLHFQILRQSGADGGRLPPGHAKVNGMTIDREPDGGESYGSSALSRGFQWCWALSRHIHYREPLSCGELQSDGKWSGAARGRGGERGQTVVGRQAKFRPAAPVLHRELGGAREPVVKS
jgi:hypothetical protein